MRLVILDRDGVINYDSLNFIKNFSEFIPIPGSLISISNLHKIGCRILITTNQSGLSKGYLNLKNLNFINKKMVKEIKKFKGNLNAIFFCRHIMNDKCYCRKPHLGMISEIYNYINLSTDKLFSIGDSLKDIKLYINFMCSAHLVLTGNGKKNLKYLNLPLNTIISNNLINVSENI